MLKLAVLRQDKIVINHRLVYRSPLGVIKLGICYWRNISCRNKPIVNGCECLRINFQFVLRQSATEVEVRVIRQVQRGFANTNL